MPVARVLVLCTGNSCRSQMAEAFLKSFDFGLEVSSAGTQPAPRTHPYAITVMDELGIDISSGCPKSVDQFTGQPFDWVITVCDDADRDCPAFHGNIGQRIHIGFDDPAKARGTHEQVLGVFRRVRDEISEKLREFYETRIKKGASS